MKKIAIIGASYLQLPLVEKANEMGVYTICFAWEEGAVCKELCDDFYSISILEKKKILEICRTLKIDGIISIASDVAVPTVNFIANALNLIGNSIDSSLRSTNKFLMRNAFEFVNLLNPKFVELDKNYNTKELSGLIYPLIVKPVDRSGSKGITVVKIPENLDKSIQYALDESFTDKVIIEEFIRGEEISVETISWKGEHYILTFTDKITSGFPHFVELEHHQPSKYLNSKLRKQIEDQITLGLNSLGIKYGASHSELLITESGEIYLIEIGARMGGDFIGSDLVFLSTGYDYLKGVINISLGYFETPIIKGSQCSGIYFYSGKTLKVRDYFSKKGNGIVKSEFRDDCINVVKQSSDRSGYFIYQSAEKLII